MNITNRHNLPAPLVAAVANDDYHHNSDISVTGLISPPQIRMLRKQYSAQLSEDVSDRIWVLLGQAVHTILERANVDGAAEERLSVEIAGWSVSGKGDLWHDQGTLSDYKVTSVWSYLIGDRWEWQAQLNLYAYLFVKHGMPVEKLQNVLILRDWQASKAVESDYPKASVAVLPQRLWTLADAESYLETRVRLHQSAAEAH